MFCSPGSGTKNAADPNWVPVEDVLGPLFGRVGGLDRPGAQHVVDGLCTPHQSHGQIQRFGLDPDLAN